MTGMAPEFDVNFLHHPLIL